MEHITTRLTTSCWRNGSVQVLKLPEPEHSQVQMLEATMTWWWWLSRHGLKNSRKPTHSRIRFDLEKLKNPTVMSAFQATIGGRFAPLAMLVDVDADLDSMVTHFNKAVTDSSWTSWQATPEEEALGYPWDPLSMWPKTRPEDKERRARRSQRL